MKAGLIGLGAMGLGMARNVAKAGLLSAVYNRTRNKADVLATEINIKSCDSPQQLAQQVDIVLICVSADKDVLQMVVAVAETINGGDPGHAASSNPASMSLTVITIVSAHNPPILYVME